MDETSNPETLTTGASATLEFPSEPFPCPACGQLLAPTCRVCVACKRPINPAEIVPVPAVNAPAAAPRETEPRPEPVGYPWRIFFFVLTTSFVLALVFEHLWGEQRAQLAIGGVQALAAAWVFFDALSRRVARPLRWAVGSLLLPVFIFPWYVARRRTPDRPVPFVEAQIGPITRFIVFALLSLILASAILYLVKGPPATESPNIQFKQRTTDKPAKVAANHFLL